MPLGHAAKLSANKPCVCFWERDVCARVLMPGLPPLRSPSVPHADAAVILPYC